MDQLSTYGEADRPQASPPQESGTVEDTHKDTSVTPDLAQGVIPGASMSVPADPAWSDPCRQDAPSQASKPIPEGSQDSSSMLPPPPPPPPPPEEPYDSYLQCMGRSKEDLVTQTPRPTSAAPLLDLASLLGSVSPCQWSFRPTRALWRHQWGHGLIFLSLGYVCLCPGTVTLLHHRPGCGPDGAPPFQT